MAQRKQKGRAPTKAQAKNRAKPDYQRVAKLNARGLRGFKYDLCQILDRSSISDEQESVFIANLITQGSRNSLEDAKNYVRSVEKEGVLEENIANDVCRLLDRNRRYR